MDQAFSLVKQNIISVKEFLEFHGDSGRLIGKNLIICNECKRNIYFKKGPHHAHFAHAKATKELEKTCSKRVAKYTPEHIRQIKRKYSKYKVGFFQQRFEDYLYLSFINNLEASNLFYPIFIPPGQEIYGKKNNKTIIHFCKVNEENKNPLIKNLREIKSKPFDNMALCSHLIENFRKSLKDFKVNSSESKWKNYFTNNYKGEDPRDEIIWSQLIHENTDESINFIYEVYNHITAKGSEKLHYPIFEIGIKSYIAVFFNLLLKELDRDFYQYKNNDPANLVVFEQKDEEGILLSIGLDIKWFELIFSKNIIPFKIRYTFTQILSCLSELAGFSNKNINQLIKVLKEEVSTKLKNGESFKEILDLAPYQENFLKIDDYVRHAITDSMLRSIRFTNLHQNISKFYGDNFNSDEEKRLRSIDENRGYIYLAYAKYGKHLWEKQIEEKGYKDVVKIGRSSNPEQRRKQIAGNYAPPESIEIIDVWPTTDMKKAESFIHQKLNKYRLSSIREIFGLTVEEGWELTNKCVHQFEEHILQNTNTQNKKKFNTKKSISGQGFK